MNIERFQPLFVSLSCDDIITQLLCVWSCSLEPAINSLSGLLFITFLFLLAS